jgi:hypothetical protein
MGFRKKEAKKGAMKVAIYGRAGSGKTLTSLLIGEGLAAASGGRIAYVDTEAGTDYYAAPSTGRRVHPEAFDFDALEGVNGEAPRSASYILRELQRLDPKQHSVIVLDSVTHIWQNAQDSYSGKKGPNGQIPMHAWGKIKAPYKALVNWLLNCPQHVIIVGREGDVYEDDGTGTVSHAGHKMKAEGETAYEPDFLIRMAPTRRKDGSQVVTAHVEKDRSGVLEPVQYEPTFATLAAPVLPMLGVEHRQVQDSESAATETADDLARDEAAREAEAQRVYEDLDREIRRASASEVDKIAKKITPKIKKLIGTERTAALRAAWVAASGGGQ